MTDQQPGQPTTSTPAAAGGATAAPGVRVEPQQYVVYPTGWDESEMGSKEAYLIYVERRSFTEDSWRVTDGYFELSSAGKWNDPDKKLRRFHRFPLTEALERARQAVDVRQGPRGTFAEANTWWTEVRPARLAAALADLEAADNT